MIAELYMQHDMPEPPKESFFKGLFGGGMRNLDREELCEYRKKATLEKTSKRNKRSKAGKNRKFSVPRN
jgi:hypothetical protein